MTRDAKRGDKKAPRAEEELHEHADIDARALSDDEEVIDDEEDQEDMNDDDEEEDMSEDDDEEDMSDLEEVDESEEDEEPEPPKRKSMAAHEPKAKSQTNTNAVPKRSAPKQTAKANTKRSRK